MNNLQNVNNVLTVDVVKHHKVTTLSNMLALINRLQYKRAEAHNIILNMDYNDSLIIDQRRLIMSLDELVDCYKSEYSKLRLVSVDNTNYRRVEEILNKYDSYIYYDRLKFNLI